MTSVKLGKRISDAEITNVSGQLLHVEMPSAHHLYWPDLDVDVAIESIDHPERFPLVSKVQSNRHCSGRARSRRAAEWQHARPQMMRK